MSAATTMAAAVENLDVERMESGQAPLQRQSCDAADLVRQAVDRMRGGRPDACPGAGGQPAADGVTSCAVP